MRLLPLSGTIFVTAGIEVLSRAIGSYYGYVEGKRKEDDLAVRQKVMQEVTKTRNNILNTLSDLHKQADAQTKQTLKRFVDELDMFKNEVDLAISGHHFPFFSIQNSANKGQIQKVVDFDTRLVGGMENLVTATSRLNTSLLNAAELDPQTEVTRMRQYLTDVRNTFKDRTDYLRGIK